MSLDFSISSGDSQLCVFVYKRDRAEREGERSWGVVYTCGRWVVGITEGEVIIIVLTWEFSNYWKAHLIYIF